MCAYIGAEWRVQHVGLQPFEVDASEDGVLLDLYGPASLTTKALLGVLGQELMHSRRMREKRNNTGKMCASDQMDLADQL